MHRPRLVAAALLWTLLCAPAALRAADAPPAAADAPPTHLARYGAGAGPAAVPGGFRVLDEARTPLQRNTVAWDRSKEGAFRRTRLRATVRLDEGGDGGWFAFLSTAKYGVRGPGPYVPSAAAPDLAGSFAVGLDVHNPPSQEMFTEWGNYEDRPQREVSLHVDGREQVKRVAPEEFRGKDVELEVVLEHVVGGAEATVRLAGATVYDRHFLAHLDPYELRLACGAGTRADATTRFDVRDVVLVQEEPATPPRPPIHVEVFDHVRTDNQTTAHTRTVELPPATWAFGRVVLTLDLHDAGEAWDEWDRNGMVNVFDDAGRRLPVVPFITSYRTPCHWTVDVTHFLPLLTGKRRFEVAAGTDFYKGRGYLMSVSLDYHHGTPDLLPVAVRPLWQGVAHYRSHENHFRDFFEPRRVAIDPAARAVRVWSTTTGHSQVGEFTPSKRALVVARADGTTTRFEDVLWKTDCYLNPNRPQLGTWQFSRAGWAPGDVVRPWWVDLSAAAPAGQTVELSWEPSRYEPPTGGEAPTEAQYAEATHVVQAYLVTYRAPEGLVPAPTLRLADVVKGSPAERAGLRAGDYLATYDGTVLDSVDALRERVAKAEASGAKELVVVAYRGSERLEVRVPPGKLGVQIATR